MGSDRVHFATTPRGTADKAREVAAKKEHETNYGAQQSNPLNTQVSGDHYKNLAIQPVEYIHANRIPFIEGCVVKYVSRWRNKGGVDDLRKAKHFIELLIELETRSQSQPTHHSV
jgi:Protein of unknwon function (DUF3310)